MRKIDTRIKEILQERSMTVRDLAEKMGKAPQYISNIINGQKGISINSLCDIAEALDVELGDLFPRKDNSPSLPTTITLEFPDGRKFKAKVVSE